MANYYEYATVDVTNPDAVGGGLGDVDGEERVCIALPGTKIHEEEFRGTTLADGFWIALTPACARELLDYLLAVEHVMPPSSRPKRSA